MSQMFDFSTFSQLGKLIYVQKSRNKQIFADPWKIANWNVQIFLAFHCDKTMQYREPIFAISFLCQSSLIHNITVPLKNILFLNYKTSSILIFTFLLMCQKRIKKKKLEPKARIENNTIPMLLKVVKPLQKIISTNSFFIKLALFYVSSGQNTILTWPKDVFSYRNLFDNCLIMKNWNLRKWLTLLYIQATSYKTVM